MNVLTRGYHENKTLKKLEEAQKERETKGLLCLSWVLEGDKGDP